MKSSDYTIEKYLSCQDSVIKLLGMVAKLGLESAQLDCKEADDGFMKFGDVYIHIYVDRVNTV
jgi:hypothetical protein